MLFRDGFEMNTWDIDTPDVDLTLPVNTFDGEFFYVKVTQADGDEAISSPVYIKGGVFNARPSCSLSSPESGTHFSNTQLITITAEASDADGSVVSVEFFVDGISLGTDTLAPYSVNYTIPADGFYEITAKATDDLGYWGTSSLAFFTVGIFSKTESSRVADALDDMEEMGDGVIDYNSSDLELVDERSNQTIGLRFTGLNIPPRAAIKSAYIQFTVDEVSTGTCVLSIKGHDADNSPQFSTAFKDVSGRLTTSAEVNWEPPDWPTVGAAGTNQRTPDLISIVQEIVNRPGYTQSSAISIIITGTGRRTAEAYEGAAESAALLTVDYTVGVEPSILTPEFDEMQVRIYPNPIPDFLNIKTELSRMESITIINLSGQIVYYEKIEETNLQIDISSFQKGIYFITVRSKDIIKTEKIIKL
jgi:hypothetical protein